MSTSVAELLKISGVPSNRLRTIRWGELPDNSSAGIFIVSTSSSPGIDDNHFESAPFDENILLRWIEKVKTIHIDGKPNPSVNELKERLNKFWIPDENILFIGQTECSGGLRKRMGQYYKIELGNRKPFIGGCLVKTLKIVNQLAIHYISTLNPVDTTHNLMNNFAAQVSEKSKKKNGSAPFPFGNLELKWNIRNHGITKSVLGD